MPLPPSKSKGRTLALDCESTGFDWAHGARPFFVTIAYDGEDPIFYQWPVDPLTRVVTPDPADLREIMAHVRRAELVIGHNIRFDVGMLATFIPNLIETWPWAKTRCTLMGDHLLASNRPHNLTDVTFRVLGVDILPAEQAIDEVTKKARDYARRHLPKWMIAREGLACMPSAKDQFHKTDMWLPKALVDAGEDVPAEWATVLSDYANTDSVVTLAVWGEQEKAIRDRKLEAIYAERLKLLPITTRMERRGVTVNRARMREMREHYATEADRLGRVCVNLAKSMGHTLELPAGKVNKSVMAFLTAPDGIGLTLSADEAAENPKLIHVPHDRRTDTGNVSAKSEHIDYYIAELRHTEPRGKRVAFLAAFQKKAGMDKTVGDVDSYEKFYIPVDGAPDTFRMHPSFNPTGAATLRWSCKRPNAQNIKKDSDDDEGESMRHGFGPAPGREWWSLDFRNLELRLRGYGAKEPSLIALFEKENEPPFYGSEHMLNFSIVYPEIWDKAIREHGPEKAAAWIKEHAPQYRWVKNGDFALAYGAVLKADGWGTADKAFHKRYAHKTLVDRFEDGEAYNRKLIGYAEKMGYVETMPDKLVDPKRGYPLLCTRTERGRILETVPLNYHIQSTAMWLTCITMVAFQDILDGWRTADGFDGFMTLQVHDEIVVDFPKSAVHPRHDGLNNPHQLLRSNLWRAKELQRVMSSMGDRIGIPCPAGLEYNELTWSEKENF